MSRRAEVPTADSVRTRIAAHAESAYPGEACGALLGSDGEISDVAALANRAEDVRDSYRLDPADLEPLLRQAAAGGLDVVGFYHSHPDAGPRPSGRDARAAWPGYVYLIMSVHGGVAGEHETWRIGQDG